MNDVGWSPDGSLLATTSNGDLTRQIPASVRLWKTAANELAWELTLGIVESAFADVKFTPDGAKVIASSWGADGDIGMWDTQTGDHLRTWTQHEKGAYGIAVSPDGSRFLSTSNDYTARIHRIDGSAPDILLCGHSWDVRGGMFSPDGTQVATASFDGTATVWDAITGEPKLTINADGGLNDVEYSPAGKHLVTAGYFTRVVQVWDAKTGDEVYRFARPQDPFEAGYSPDGQLLAIAEADEVSLWDSNTYEQRFSIRRNPHFVQFFEFSPDGRFITVGGADARTYFVELDDLIKYVEDRLVRGFTDDECRQYLHLPDGCSRDGS
jgi:WD40 repeat protein